MDSWCVWCLTQHLLEVQFYLHTGYCYYDMYSDADIITCHFTVIDAAKLSKLLKLELGLDSVSRDSIALHQHNLRWDRQVCDIGCTKQVPF